MGRVVYAFTPRWVLCRPPDNFMISTIPIACSKVTIRQEPPNSQPLEISDHGGSFHHHRSIFNFPIWGSRPSKFLRISTPPSLYFSGHPAPSTSGNQCHLEKRPLCFATSIIGNRTFSSSAARYCFSFSINQLSSGFCVCAKLQRSCCFSQSKKFAGLDQ